MKTFKQYLLESDNQQFHHHITNIPFEKGFHPFTHFGTEDASLARAARINQDNPNITSFDRYKVSIDKGNTVHISDPIIHTPSKIAKLLHSHGHITKEQHKKIAGDMSTVDSNYGKYKKLASFLRDNGIHTISYTNKVEHPGSTSYMITHPKQVSIHKKDEGVSVDIKRGRSNLESLES